MNIYEDMRDALSQEMAEEMDQGDLVYTAPAYVTGPEWDPVETQAAPYAVKGVARGVQQKYVDGTYINASDIQCTLSVFETEPTTSGTMQIAGRTHQIIRVDRIPATGTVVAWRVFCKS